MENTNKEKTITLKSVIPILKEIDKIIDEVLGSGSKEEEKDVIKVIRLMKGIVSDNWMYAE